MDNKKEWLEMIEGDIESLVEWSKSNPDPVNRLVCKQELKELQALAEDLTAGGFERESD